MSDIVLRFVEGDRQLITLCRSDTIPVRRGGHCTTDQIPISLAPQTRMSRLPSRLFVIVG